MGIIQSGPKNPNWKGGRTVASNGYVLLKMSWHHLADTRGYVYEHRLIAEEKIGRRLTIAEQVHHLNGDKSDNRPENLDVVESIAHHRMVERTVGFNRRKPGEANTEIACACGCGEFFWQYDLSGRPRRFVTGHNMNRR